MAITSITVIQDNKVSSKPLLSVHNPLVFIVEANYTSTAPDTLYVSESVNSGVYSCIPYSDPQSGKRQFMFIADEIIRGLMQEFDDTVQADSSNEFRPNKTLDITLTFYDPTTPATNCTIAFIAIHGSRQFGESPCLDAIYNNDDEIYVGVVGSPCYCYFFNDSTSNVLTVVES